MDLITLLNLLSPDEETRRNTLIYSTDHFVGNVADLFPQLTPEQAMSTVDSFELDRETAQLYIQVRNF